METHVAYTLYAFSAISALVGLVIGAEAHPRTAEQTIWFRWIMLISLAAGAMVRAREASDLLFLIAVPIGCYKLGQMLGEPIGWLWRRWR